MTNVKKAFENMVQEIELAAKAIIHEFDDDKGSPEWELGNAMDVLCRFYRGRTKPEVKNENCRSGLFIRTCQALKGTRH